MDTVFKIFLATVRELELGSLQYLDRLFDLDNPLITYIVDI